MQDLLDQIFDAVIVVSLPSAAERRTHIARHFSETGIHKFRFFDAIGPDHPDAHAAFHSSLTAKYPPCFRCGKKRCGRKDCNNVLIPPQIANFVTQQKLWRHIAGAPQRALIVEDDVVFQANAPTILSDLAHAIQNGDVVFEASAPTLMRLGWALGKDHQGTEFRLTTESRMSNPCYGVTSAFAAMLGERFERYDTTSDVFLHQRAPRDGEAVTVLPPIASELSWSVGAVASQIHPKPLRTDYLRQQGDEAAARENEEKVKSHLAHISYRPLLFLHHPDTVEETLSEQLGASGVNFDHGDENADAACLWTFAVDDEAAFFGGAPAPRRAGFCWDRLVHPVCDLQNAASRICAAEDRGAPGYDFRRRWIRQEFLIDLEAFESALDRAVISYCLWNQLIARLQPDLSFRIEDQAGVLAEFLHESGFAPKTPPAREMPQKFISAQTMDWAGLHPVARGYASAYCRRYGYAGPPLDAP